MIGSEAVGGAEIVSGLRSGKIKLNKHCRGSGLYQKYFKSTFYFLFFQNKNYLFSPVPFKNKKLLLRKEIEYKLKRASVSLRAHDVPSILYEQLYYVRTLLFF